MTSAFTFNASACSGCKACQAACKDKNNLPTGVLWRRVYEVTGGSWQRNGAAWNNTVFAYNLSMSCNHCLHPKCAGVCPVDAYSIRPDGIVVLDTTKCIGCGYCAWACPYGAPQYNPETGHMTKCDLCFDNLEQGLPPACVAACPLRVLDYAEAVSDGGLQLWDIPAEKHPYPLPIYSHTQPRLAIRPHATMSRTENRSLANLEEVRPRLPSSWEEAPLVLYTLLTQMAVGGFWAMTWMFPMLWSLVQFDATVLRLLPALLIGCSLSAGMLVSFAHLGTKKNAWRVLCHLRKSWLSREILFTLLFGLGCLVTTMQMFQHYTNLGWITLTSLLGFCLIYSMARVYRLPAAPGWNTWHTNVEFLVTTLLLGLSSMMPLLVYEANLTGIQVLPSRLPIIHISILILSLLELALMNKRTLRGLLQKARIGLIVGAVLLAAFGFMGFSIGVAWFGVLIPLVVLVEEGLGRWLFYQSRLGVVHAR